jgi:phage/plasmid-like protein (TIGR03299 family)
LKQQLKETYIMAHMIEIVNGKAQMAYAGDVPWHGLGTKVPADLTPDQMLEAAGLDWTVEKKDLTFEVNGEQIVAPGKKALVRSSDGALLDVIGDNWNPLQNSEAFEFFNDFVAAGDMEMHTAGSLEDGRRVWALAKVNDTFEVFKGDAIEQFLLFSNPHKYGQVIDVRMTPTRVVCNNTLTMALDRQSDSMVKVNHRHEFDADLVKETLGVAKEKLETYKEAARFLGSKRYTADSIVEYFNGIFPASAQKAEKKEISRTANQALEILETQPGAEFGAGSWWSAFNSVTYMTDHVLGRGADTRMQSAWFGANQKKKQGALQKAIEFADAA